MSLRFHIRNTAYAAAFTLLAGCAASPGDGTLYLGFAGPANGAVGRTQRLGAQLAVAQINEAGGLAGRPLEIIYKDDEGDPERAIEVATELRANARVLAVIGHINSAATLDAAQIYNDPEQGLVQVSPSSTSPEVSEAGPWTFRVCASDLQQGPALAQWVYEGLGRRRAVVLYANDAYGRGVLGSFAEAFEAAGGTVLSRDPYLPALITSDRTLDPYIERAMGSGMDVLVIAGMVDEAEVIIEAARRLGYDGPVVGTDGLLGIETAGEVAEGVYVGAPFLADRPTPEAQAFVRDYREHFGEVPDGDAAMAYDAVRLVASALEAVIAQRQATTDVQTLRRALRDRLAGVGTATPPFQGVAGAVAFDENGDVIDKEIVIGVVRGGELVSAGT